MFGEYKDRKIWFGVIVHLGETRVNASLVGAWRYEKLTDHVNVNNG